MKTAKKDKDKDKKGRNTWRSADVKLRAINFQKVANLAVKLPKK